MFQSYATNLLPGDRIIGFPFSTPVIVNLVRPSREFGRVWIDYTKPGKGADAGLFSACCTFNVERS